MLNKWNDDRRVLTRYIFAKYLLQVSMCWSPIGELRYMILEIKEILMEKSWN